MSKYCSNANFTEAVFLHIIYICSIFFILLSQQYWFYIPHLIFFSQSSKVCPISHLTMSLPAGAEPACGGKSTFSQKRSLVRHTLFLRSWMVPWISPFSISHQWLVKTECTCALSQQKSDTKKGKRKRKTTQLISKAKHEYFKFLSVRGKHRPKLFH